MGFDHIRPGRVRKDDDQPAEDDVLGAMCDSLISHLEGLRHYHPGIRMIVMLDDADAKRGTSGIHNYGSEKEVMENALRQVKAIFAAYDQPFQILDVGSN